MKQKGLFHNEDVYTPDATVEFTLAGGVPGGHLALRASGSSKPFVPSMSECHSIELRYSDVVVDIGAYCGTYALYAARVPVKKVVAYEPTQRSFDVLARNAGVDTCAHPLANLTIVRKAVVGDAHLYPKIDLYHSRGVGTSNSIFPKPGNRDTETVETLSYVDAVKGASVVKIDVEGAEYEYPIIQPGIRALIIEFHPRPKCDWVANAEKLIADIVASGFETVTRPSFKSGWDRTGSWIRPIKTTGQCMGLMNGNSCTGCGLRLQACGSKALCPSCYELWRSSVREGFERSMPRL